MKNTTVSSSLSFGLTGLLALTGCVGTSDSALPEKTALETLSVVVTTTILGSVVRDIVTCAVGDDAGLSVIMPMGVDPHDFQASSEQVALMVGADLTVVNGLGLEAGLVSTFETLSAEGNPIFEVAGEVNPLPFGRSDDDHAGEEKVSDDHAADEHAGEEKAGDDHANEDEDEDEHGHGGFDPHFWFDMDRMATAAELVGVRLGAVGGEQYVICGESVGAEIRVAEGNIIRILSAVPSERRILVTDHDALAYFANRYDFEVVGVVIPGGSTLGETSSQDLATLVSVMRDRQVSAIFGNQATNADILAVLADEVGSRVSVTEVFVGSLGGPGSEAETYIDMMTTNATRISQALAD
jgi:zinc/manganese transport system substrate-binding protein